MPSPALALTPAAPPARASAGPLRALDALAGRPRLAVAIAAVLPYLRTLWGQPVLDDGWQVLDNPLVQRLGNAARVFAEPFGFAGGPTVAGPFRPLTTLSFALGYAAHGRATPGYHLVNLALHALASVLVVLLARRAADAALAPPARAARVALVAGLLFALHPVHVEAVAPIVGRSELLAFCLCAGALLVALGAGRRPARLALAAALQAAAMLCKEGVVVAPLLYLVVAFALPGAAGLAARPGLREPARRRALVAAALVAGALAAAALPYFALRGFRVAAPPEAQWFAGVPGVTVALTASRVLAEYLRVLAFPAFLGTDFAYAARVPAIASPDLAFAAATLAWLAVLAAALLALRRAPLAAAGGLWVFAALLPVLHLVPIGALMAERLAYLASAGACLAAAALAVPLLERAAAAGPAGRRLGAAAGLAVAALLGIRSAVRAGDWRDGIALWEAELPKAPRDPVVNNNLAVAYTSAGAPARALAPLRTAITVAPGYWRAHVNLGIALQRTGDRDGARRALLEAMRLAPASSSPPFFLALLVADEGDLRTAVFLLAHARELAPEEARLARVQGDYLLRLGRRDDARAALADAVRLDPADPDARRLLERASR